MATKENKSAQGCSGELSGFSLQKRTARKQEETAFKMDRTATDLPLVMSSRLAFTYPLVNNRGFHHLSWIWNEKRPLRNVTRAERRLRLRGELPFDSDGERRRERITRSCGNREALPLDRLWKAEQIGGGKGIFRHLCIIRALASRKARFPGTIRPSPHSA